MNANLQESTEHATAPETEGRLVHLLWYTGTGTTIAALTVFAERIAGGHIMRLAVLLTVYALLASGVALFFQKRERARNVLTGLLVTAAILAGTSAWLLAQDHFGYLNYTPLPRWYDTCGTNHAHIFSCAEYPKYSTVGYVLRLTESPLGAVTAATAASIAAIAIFRFLPMTIIAVLGSWYMLFEMFGPTNERDWAWALLWCGVLSLLLSWIFDLKLKNNYGFWVNKLGTWGIAAGLVYFFADQPEGSRFLYLLLNVLGMLVALYLKRSAGVIGFLAGCCNYIWHEYTTTFKDSDLFPYVLFCIGAIQIYLGWRLHRARLDLEIIIPKFLRKLRPEERREPVFFGTEAILEKLH